MNRETFEKTPWKRDDKGAPVNPAADPDCGTCDGFGVTERRDPQNPLSDAFAGFENCPHCWTKRMTIEELEAMGARLKE